MSDPGDVTPASRQRSRSPRGRRLLGFLLCVAAIASGLATLASFFGRQSWVCDNATAFLPQYAILGCITTVLLLAVRWPGWACLAAVTVLLNTARIWPDAEPPRGGVGEPLRIVSANVKTSNREFGRLIRYVRSVSPDVLVVIETDGPWIRALDELRDELPHLFFVLRDDNFGLTLLSRKPLKEAKAAKFGNGNPAIVARLEHDGRQITFVCAHPLPPVGAEAAAARNRQLAAIAEFVRSESGEVVVVGDLNMAPWSPHFRELLNEAGLSDSRAAFGVHPTWPADFPPMLTPIDHLLVTDGVATVDRRVGPRIGSDHLPIQARIALRQSTSR